MIIFPKQIIIDNEAPMALQVPVEFDTNSTYSFEALDKSFELVGVRIVDYDPVTRIATFKSELRINKIIERLSRAGA